MKLSSLFALCWLWPLLSIQAAIIDFDLIGTTAVRAENVSTTTTVVTIDMVEVRAVRRGHLLALVPIDLDVRVKAWANGEVEIELPWYASLTIMDRETLFTKLRAVVSNVRHKEALSSVKAEGQAILPSFTSEEVDEISLEMKKVLKDRD